MWFIKEFYSFVKARKWIFRLTLVMMMVAMIFLSLVIFLPRSSLAPFIYP
jgi:hypothetical protein